MFPRQQRARSSDLLRLPKVMEANEEENYQELKKKILFQHKINTLVDKTEQLIVDKGKGNLAILEPGPSKLKDLTLPKFIAIEEDPMEDFEVKKNRKMDLFSSSISSRRSSRKSSLLNSPMSRSLKRMVVDEVPMYLDHHNHDRAKIIDFSDVSQKTQFLNF